MIKCGKCGEKHETVQEVRKCYTGLSLDTTKGANGLPAEEAFLNGGRTEKKSGNAYYRELATGLPDLRRARYAVEIGNTLKFYQVDKPDEGKWAGYTFLKVQASDETYPVRDLTTRISVLEEIVKDPQAAMERYGQEIGQCGHCGRTLTNEESREIGIGPICRAKMGW